MTTVLNKIWQYLWGHTFSTCTLSHSMVLTHYHPLNPTLATSRCLPISTIPGALALPGLKPFNRSRICKPRPLHMCNASTGNEKQGNVEVVMESPEELCRGINLPRRSAGKKRKLLFIAILAGAEYLATSAIVWSPLVAALGIIAFSSSDRDIKAQEDEYVERARRMAGLDYWRKLPMTPKEPAEWLNRLIQGLWGGYVQQFIVTNNLGLWQEKIADMSPNNWDIQVRDFELGESAPTISDVQVLNDTAKPGKFSAMDMAVTFDTGTLSVTAEGVGPVGSFTLSVSGVTMMGNVRVLPVFEHRMLLYSFQSPPRLDLKLGVKGPAIGKMDIPQFDFVKRTVQLAISDLMVEPNRGCISLDYEPIGRRAIDAACNIEIESIVGASLPASVTKSNSQIAGICIEVVNVATKTRRKTLTVPLVNGKAYFGEKFSINLGDMAGVVEFEVFAVGKNGKKARSKPLGKYRMNVAHMGDGSTGFWSIDRDWKPVAYRWKDKQPWEVTLPVRGMDGAEVKMKLSMSQWTYMQPYAPLVYRSKGERTVVLQVVEARALVPKDMGGTSDPYVKLNYNTRSYTSHTIFKTTNPVWGDTFVFSENSSLVSKRIRGEVWDKDFTSSDDREGFFFVDLNLASEGKITDRWFQLSGEESGEVRIRFTVLPGMVTSQSTKDFVREMKSTPVRASTPTVTVNVWGAKKLRAMDANGKSDPFCEIRYGDLQQVTPAMQGTLNPNWNFSARFPYNPAVSTIKVECLDKDTFQLQRKSMGSVMLNVEELVPGEEDNWDAWMPLQGGKQGKVSVGLVRMPADEELASMDFKPPKTRMGTEDNSRNGTKVTTLTGEDGNTEVKENNQEALKSLEGFVKDAGKQFDGFVQNLQKFWSD